MALVCPLLITLKCIKAISVLLSVSRGSPLLCLSEYICLGTKDAQSAEPSLARKSERARLQFSTTGNVKETESKARTSSTLSQPLASVVSKALSKCWGTGHRALGSAQPLCFTLEKDKKPALTNCKGSKGNTIRIECEVALCNFTTSVNHKSGIFPVKKVKVWPF